MRFKFILLFHLFFYKIVIIRAEILAYQTQGGGNKEGVFHSEFLAFESKPTATYGVSLISITIFKFRFKTNNKVKE